MTTQTKPQWYMLNQKDPREIYSFICGECKQAVGKLFFDDELTPVTKEVVDLKKCTICKRHPNE